MVRMKLIVLAATVLCSSAGSAVGGATFIGPLPYLSEADSPFDLGNPAFLLETFEDDLLNVPGVSVNVGPGAVIGPGGLTDSVDGDDGVIDGNGTFGHSIFNAGGATGLTFTFSAKVLGGLPTHAGIVWTDGVGTTTFQAFGPGGESLGTIGPVAIATPGTTGQTDEDRFFGVINEAGILSIKISNTAGGIEADHLQYNGEAVGCPKAGTDLTGDGAVNGADLSILLLAWGRCSAGECCEPDFSQNGEVDGQDLGLLLLDWTG